MTILHLNHTNASNLLRDLHAGKHFIGLWVYREYKRRDEGPLWVVTFRDADHEYWETSRCHSPEEALIEAKSILGLR